MILNKSRAEAIYSAVCALNNVGGIFNRVSFGWHASAPEVRCPTAGTVIVESGVGQSLQSEFYSDWNEFAAAYGLN